MIDAAALVAMPLAEIRLRGQSLAAPPGSDLDVILDRSQGLPAGSVFSWARHGNAAAYFALQAARRSGAAGGMAAESNSFESHAGFLPTEIPDVLGRLLARGEPSTVSRAAEATRVAAAALATIAAKPGYVAGAGFEHARTSLLQPGRLDQVAELTRRFEALDAEPGASGSSASELRRQVMSAARQAMARLGRGGGTGFTPAEELALEALIRLRDRAAIRVKNGTIEITPEHAGDWFAALLGARDYLTSVIGSVGRIDVDGFHVGTGTVVAPGTLLTNRHVAEGFADGIRGPDGRVRWFMTGTATVNFDEDAADQASAFVIGGVIAADPNRFFSGVRLTDLDLALVSVELVNRAGRALPNGIGIISHPKFATAIQDIFVVGYPARPGLGAITDPSSRLLSMPLAEALAAMFGASFGVKYLSPGRMTGRTGDIAEDTRRWVFSHDATTLGGSSGSGAFLLGEPRGMLGLHFSGNPTINNYAHSLAAVRGSGAVPPEEMAKLTWV